jgi:hypothetical protein
MRFFLPSSLYCIRCLLAIFFQCPLQLLFCPLFHLLAVTVMSSTLSAWSIYIVCPQSCCCSSVFSSFAICPLHFRCYFCRFPPAGVLSFPPYVCRYNFRSPSVLVDLRVDASAVRYTVVSCRRALHVLYVCTYWGYYFLAVVIRYSVHLPLLYSDLSF